MKASIYKFVQFIYLVITNKVIYPLYYKLLLISNCKQIDSKKIIIDNKGYSKLDDSFLCLISYIKEKTDYQLVIYNNRNKFKGDFKIIKEIATSKYIFLTTFHFLIDNLPLRKETIVINLWHGCGIFKKFGYSSVNTKWGGKHLRTFNTYKNTNLFTSSSPFCVPFLQEAINHTNDNVVIPIGTSRTDCFFDAKYKEQAHSELLNICPLIKNKKIILYAPTFRGDKLKQSTYPDFLDFNKIKEKLSDKYVLLIKHHPSVKKQQLIPLEYQDCIFNLSGKIEINKLLCCSDILISDYSSLIFEYSLLEKPMIFFGPDIDQYNEDRGFFQEYFSMIPGPLCRSTDELISCIENFTEINLLKIKEFKNKYMSSCDGNVNKKIFDYIEQL